MGACSGFLGGVIDGCCGFGDGGCWGAGVVLG